MFSVVKIVGEHESQEGDCNWGYAVWDADYSMFEPNRMFSTKSDAISYIEGHGGQISDAVHE